MSAFVSLGKRSKKKQKEYYSKQRCTRGQLNPVTRTAPYKKSYNRNKEKQWFNREMGEVQSFE